MASEAFKILFLGRKPQEETQNLVKPGDKSIEGILHPTDCSKEYLMEIDIKALDKEAEESFTKLKNAIDGLRKQPNPFAKKKSEGVNIMEKQTQAQSASVNNNAQQELKVEISKEHIKEIAEMVAAKMPTPINNNIEGARVDLFPAAEALSTVFKRVDKQKRQQDLAVNGSRVVAAATTFGVLHLTGLGQSMSDTTKACAAVGAGALAGELARGASYFFSERKSGKK